MRDVCARLFEKATCDNIRFNVTAAEESVPDDKNCAFEAPYSQARGR